MALLSDFEIEYSKEDKASEDTKIQMKDINFSRDIRIEGKKLMVDNHSEKVKSKVFYRDFFAFRGTVFKNSDGWMSVLLTVRRTSQGFGCDLQWTVSTIDNERNSRFPRSFTKFDARNSKRAKYLEICFLRSRADEFLPNGFLTLRWDISCTVRYVLDRLFANNYESFDRNIPNAVSSRKETYVDDTDSPDLEVKVFDFTGQVLYLPQFHELRKRFGIYGKSPWDGESDDFPITEPNEVYISDHVWIFDTDPHRCLISWEGGQSDLGPRLLEASPVIRHCVYTTMREQRERRVVLPTVKSYTFLVVMEYLRWDYIRCTEFYELMDVYEMSHLYAMEGLQKACADRMATFSGSIFVKQMKIIADSFSDQYLLNLLNSQNEKRSDFECYV